MVTKKKTPENPESKPVKKMASATPETKPAKKKSPATPETKTATGPAASGQIPDFPKKELDKWLKAHKTWNHDDWVELLDDLKAKGYGKLIGKKAGKDSVGMYLETNRKK
jgi:hypothetical protein